MAKSSGQALNRWGRRRQSPARRGVDRAASSVSARRRRAPQPARRRGTLRASAPGPSPAGHGSKRGPRRRASACRPRRGGTRRRPLERMHSASDMAGATNGGGVVHQQRSGGSRQRAQAGATWRSRAPPATPPPRKPRQNACARSSRGGTTATRRDTPPPSSPSAAQRRSGRTASGRHCLGRASARRPERRETRMARAHAPSSMRRGAVRPCMGGPMTPASPSDCPGPPVWMARDRISDLRSAAARRWGRSMCHRMVATSCSRRGAATWSALPRPSMRRRASGWSSGRREARWMGRARVCRSRGARGGPHCGCRPGVRAAFPGRR